MRETRVRETKSSYRTSNERYVRIAKLLAEENIEVRFEKVKTASMDIENRILRLPIFENLSNDIFGMMVAHEVGHSLFTPDSEWKEWIHPEAPGAKARKTYANVIEDVRIERMIKRRFPGVVKDMQLGYNLLHKKGFFGIKENEDLSDRPLIDRINLNYKSYGHLDVPFTPEESVWLERVDNVQTFQDVLTLSRELMEYEKERKEEERQEQQEEPGDGDSGESETTEDSGDDSGETDNVTMPDDDGDEGSGTDDGEESDDTDPEPGSSDESDDDGDEGSVSDADGDDEGDEDGETSNDPTIGGDNGDSPMDDDDILDDDTSMSSMENSLEEAATESGDSWSSSPYIALTDSFIRQNWESTVLSAEGFYSEGSLHEHYEENRDKYAAAYRYVVSANKKMVSALGREFEQKRSARVDKRTSEGRTGRLNMNKLYQASYNEDIFLRNERRPEGQNHGVVMYVDMSGSMNNIISRTFVQVFNMVTFLDRQSVPYRVYGFSDTSNFKRNVCVKPQIDQTTLGDELTLIELIRSDLPKNLKRKALEMIAGSVIHSYRSEAYGTDNEELVCRFGALSIWRGCLGGTPLNSALYVAPYVIKDFQKKHNVEKTSFILYTDGGAGDNLINTDSLGRRTYLNFRYSGRETVFDNLTKRILTNDGSFFGSFQAMLTQRVALSTGAKVMGFHIVSEGKPARFTNTVQAMNNRVMYGKVGNTERGLYTWNNVSGFDSFTLVWSNMLDGRTVNIDDTYRGQKDILEATAGAVGTAFIKASKHNTNTKFLVRDLIDVLA